MSEDDDPRAPRPRPGATFDRFRHLERERAAPVEVELGAEAAARFGATPAPSVGAPLAARAPSRFEVPLETVAAEAPSDDEQPFVVCAACHIEGGKYAARCHICGASYDTPAQRAFNEKLWAEHRAQREAEREAAAERAEALEDAARAEAVRRRRMLESLARDVRLEYESPLRGFDFHRSPLLSLLRKLPRPYGVITGAAMVLAPLAACLASPAGSFDQSLAGSVLFLVVGAFVPPSWYGMDRW